MCQPLHQNAKGRQNTPHAVTGRGEPNPAAAVQFIGCSTCHEAVHYHPGAAGGLVKRPKFEVWAIQSQDGRPPGPLLHLHQTPPQSQAWQAVTSLDSGQACSRRSSSTLGEEIWRGQSMAICRSGAYLRRSHWLLVREGVSRAASGLQNTRRKSGHLRQRSRFGDFCATMLLCIASRYLLCFSGYPRRDVGLRLNACRPGAQKDERLLM